MLLCLRYLDSKHAFNVTIRITDFATRKKNRDDDRAVFRCGADVQLDV
jgi:hypothetical protein